MLPAAFASAPVARRHVRHVVVGALLLILGSAIGCASSSNSYEERELTPEERADIRLKSQTTKNATLWRQQDLPDLLKRFGSDNPNEWRAVRAQLLAPGLANYTPSLRQDGDGEDAPKYSTYIRARLEADDWDGERSRKWLVRQGLIYQQLAVFHNSSNRTDWTQARKTMMTLTDSDERRLAALREAGKEDDRTDYEKEDVPAERCAFELVLRLLSRDENEKAEADNQKFGRANSDPRAGLRGNERIMRDGRLWGVTRPANADWADEARENRMGGKTKLLRVEDKSLWCVEELAELREYAIAPIIWGTWLSDQVGRKLGSSAEAAKFYDLLFLALARMDELAVPALLIDLGNSMQLDDDAWRYHRVRRTVRTLGDIYGPERFSTPVRVERDTEFTEDGGVVEGGYQYAVRRERVRPEWQETAEHRVATLAAIAEVMRNFRAQNDTQQFQMRNYCIDAMVEIGDPAACQHLIKLWDEIAGDDEFLEELIEDALGQLSGRRLRSRDAWRSYVAGLTARGNNN